MEREKVEYLMHPIYSS